MTKFIVTLTTEVAEKDLGECHANMVIVARNYMHIRESVSVSVHRVDYELDVPKEKSSEYDLVQIDNVLKSYNISPNRRASIITNLEAAGLLNGGTHNDQTIAKVHEALVEDGFPEMQADSAIHALQNAGILFRERS